MRTVAVVVVLAGVAFSAAHTAGAASTAACQAQGDSVLLSRWDAATARQVGERFTAYTVFAERRMSPPAHTGTVLREVCNHQGGPAQASFSVFEVARPGVASLVSDSNDCPQCMGIRHTIRVESTR